MNRKINLISNDSQKLDNLENINIQQLNTIFPYSCELIVCKYFNIFEEADAEKALDLLLEKIRPQGQLIIGLIDLTRICNDLLAKKINNTDFFAFIKNIHNHFGLDDIFEYINRYKNINLLDINNNQQYINFATLSKNQ